VSTFTLNADFALSQQKKIRFGIIDEEKNGASRNKKTR
jgi:hypothetical protein